MKKFFVLPRRLISETAGLNRVFFFLSPTIQCVHVPTAVTNFKSDLWTGSLLLAMWRGRRKTNKLWKYLLKQNFIRKPLSSSSSKAVNLVTFLLPCWWRCLANSIQKRSPFTFSSWEQHKKSTCVHSSAGFSSERKFVEGMKIESDGKFSQRGKLLERKTIIDNSETRKKVYEFCNKLIKRFFCFVIPSQHRIKFFPLDIVIFSLCEPKTIKHSKVICRAYVFATLIFLGFVWFSLPASGKNDF